MTIPTPDPNRHFSPRYRKAIEEEARRVGSRPYRPEERDPATIGGFEEEGELEEFLIAYREWRQSG